MKAVTCTESLAIVGWSCAAEVDAQTNNSIVDTINDEKVEAENSFFIKTHLLIRFRFFIGGLALSSLHRDIKLVKKISGLVSVLL